MSEKTLFDKCDKLLRVMAAAGEIPAHYAPPYQKHSGTSREGAKKAKGNAASQAAIVLSYIKDHPDGVADFQIAEFLGAKYPNVKESSWRRARIGLVEIGMVAPRKTTTACEHYYADDYCIGCVSTTLSPSGVRVALWFTK